MKIIELIKKYPYTISVSIGLFLIWVGLGFWCGFPQMLIILGLCIILVTLSSATENSAYL